LTYILVSHDLAVVSHMCERLAVMQTGKVIEELSAVNLRQRRARLPYTQELIASSD
jgi:peptide/nickel transport system ATP-binding protein